MKKAQYFSYENFCKSLANKKNIAIIGSGIICFVNNEKNT
jgi:hypothetical protein